MVSATVRLRPCAPQQRHGVCSAQVVHGRLFDAVRSGSVVASGQDQRDRAVLDASGREGQRVAGLGVEPLQVVDEDKDRPCDRGRVEQREQGCGHDQRAAWRLGAAAQRVLDRAPLSRYQGFDLGLAASEQCVQAGVGQLALVLSAPAAHDGHPVPEDGRLVEECGLAGAGFPEQQQGAASTGPGSRQQPVDPRQHLVPADQHPGESAGDCPGAARVRPPPA